MKRLVLTALLLAIPINPNAKTLHQQEVIEINNVPITAYCYGTRTASGQKVREGHIALSRPLVKLHNLRFGDEVVVEGMGTYEYQDHMPYPRWRHPKCDIYMASKAKAITFGIRHLKIIIKKKPRLKTP